VRVSEYLNIRCLFSVDNIELGVACSKFYRASVMSITDPGDSDIIRAMAPES